MPPDGLIQIYRKAHNPLKSYKQGIRELTEESFTHEYPMFS
jgi:hypothetical protein